MTTAGGTVMDAPREEALVEAGTGASDLLEDVGLTYRRLDYWTRRGYLKADREKSGSGHPRSWSTDELAVARAMCRLTGAGFSLSVAASLAREHYASGDLTVPLGPGLLLGFTPDLWAPSHDTEPEGREVQR